MKKIVSGSIVALGLVVFLVSPIAAQEEAPAGMPPEMEAYMKAMTPGEAHQALATGVGTFKMDFTSWMAPGAEPTKGEGVATRTMTNGGRILEERVKASMMGMPFEGVGQTGYDNVMGQHWATWIDSMSTGIYVSKEVGNADGVVTFDGESSDPVTGGMKAMKVVIHPEKDGVQLSEFFSPNEAGGEYKMMEITYTRQDS